MNKITSITELRESIALLEVKQAHDGAMLKEQIKVSYENLKPLNLIKNTLSELGSELNLKADLVNVSMSLAAGFITKKIVVGTPDTPLKKAIGMLIQLSVTSIAAKNTDEIKSFANYLINNVLTKKDTETTT